jgi:hypothetical protein
MAIRDPATGQNALCASIVGLDTQEIYPAVPNGLAGSTNLVATRIGGATQAVEDPRYPGKALQFRQATGAVAPDGVVIAGWLNRTGKTLANGNWIIAVAV